MKYLFILLTFSLFACNAPRNPEFKKMENVKFKSVSFANGLAATLQADAIFHNPNLMGANVTEVDLDMYINDIKVTRIRQEVSAKMEGDSDFTLPLDFEVPLKEVFKDWKPTIGNLLKKQTIDYRMVGNIKVGLGNLEVKVPVEYADKSDISLK